MKIFKITHYPCLFQLARAFKSGPTFLEQIHPILIVTERLLYNFTSSEVSYLFQVV